MFPKEELVLFIVMFLIALSADSMNMMVSSPKDIYLSKSLIISSFYMATNMIWGHQIVHYFTRGHFDKTIFFFGVCLSMVTLYIMRQQVFITPRDWLKAMIPHHSTAITTTSQLLQKKAVNLPINSSIYKLAHTILDTQQKEILAMEHMLQGNT